jgi:UDP-N-acetylmuramyl pentapeptide synthase
VTRSPTRQHPPSPLRRRPPKVDTERALAIRACARHLKDLRRAHKQPLANVRVNERGVPKFVAPIIEQSYCTSPAALCAELAELGDRAQFAGAAELAKLAELGAELTELDAELAELLK